MPRFAVSVERVYYVDAKSQDDAIDIVLTCDMMADETVKASARQVLNNA